jgi:hypothetical protein
VVGIGYPDAKRYSCDRSEKIIDHNLEYRILCSNSIWAGVASVDDDGFVALVSALEQNTSLQILNLHGNVFDERGGGRESAEHQRLQHLYSGFQSVLALLLDVA